jgi:GNAT superfamily N-acetyltransferase
MTIREASISDLELLVPLFDGYRMFYKQASDLERARKFLTSRITQGESVIYIAMAQEKPIGFTQLYPIFSSVSMEPMYILNDLFIDAAYRSKGVGTALIDAVKQRCIAENQKGIVIQTKTTNPAQKLYEHLGFKKDPDLHYFWATK